MKREKTIADVVTVAIPRDALTVVAPSPELISQKNCGHVGYDEDKPKSFLEDARAFERDGGERIVRGRLVLVPRVAFVAWLRESSRRRDIKPDNLPAKRDAVADLGAELGIEMEAAS